MKMILLGAITTYVTWHLISHKATNNAKDSNSGCLHQRLKTNYATQPYVV